MYINRSYLLAIYFTKQSSSKGDPKTARATPAKWHSLHPSGARMALSRAGSAGCAAALRCSAGAGLGRAPEPGRRGAARRGGPRTSLPRRPARSAGMSDGDNRCDAASAASPEPPSLARQAPGGQTLTLQTGLLAPHQPSEVAPQQASCTLVKPEVT